MSVANTRAQVIGILQDVAGIGQVHDYFRHVTKGSEINDTFRKNGKLHFWCVCLAPGDAYVTRRYPSNFEHATYTFEIHGWHVVQDAQASEKTFADLVEAVIAAFRANKKLNNTVIESGPLQWTEGGGPESWRMMPPGDGGSLCHYARLRLPVLVHTEP